MRELAMKPRSTPPHIWQETHYYAPEVYTRAEAVTITPVTSVGWTNPHGKLKAA
ncbi:MAG TPA: hypothetical protein VK763_00705 [Terriglobales bacterium]|jgi:hypothetical protein|nr:hypothetical protein [Terriglobales bacterium]